MKNGIAAVLAFVCVVSLVSTGLASGLEGHVTASTLYVREQPFSESTTIHYIMNGEKVSIQQKVNEWYHVTCANGLNGYVYAQFVSIGGTDLSSLSNSRATAANLTSPAGSPLPTSPATQAESAPKATPPATVPLPSTMRIGDRGDGVSAIQQALSNKGYDTGKIDGVFGQITLQAVRKFQKDNGLVVDGIVGKATIQALFGNTSIDYSLVPSVLASGQKSGKATSSQLSPMAASAVKPGNQPSAPAASGAKTQSLSWFSEGYTLINSNKNITIFDLKTGVVWGAKYINGQRHADIIPASPGDAKKIASSNIVGSYIRRPVVVTIGGSDYAGSMYAVGHGDTSYCEYFAGVMCVHFTGSQTHGTQKVDADHQKAIQVALKATVNH